MVLPSRWCRSGWPFRNRRPRGACQFTEHHTRQITRPMAIAVHNAINIHSTEIFWPENSGRSARLDFASTKRCSETNAGASPPEKKPQKRGFFTRFNRLPFVRVPSWTAMAWARRESIVPWASPWVLTAVIIGNGASSQQKNIL